MRSLMIDQVVAANKYGIQAAAVMKDEMDDNTIRGIKDGKFSLVYLSPEMLLDSEWNHVLLKSHKYQEKVCAIVIDEVHLLDTWSNICLNYKSEPRMDPMKELSWYLTLLTEKGKDAPKAILYVRSVSLLGKLHRDVAAELPDDAYNGPKCCKNRIIGTFHAGLSSPDQKSIVENFTKTDSVIRFMICTIAGGGQGW